MRASYSTSQCTICGQEITQSGQGRVSHMRTHVRAGDLVELSRLPYQRLSRGNRTGSVTVHPKITFDTPECFADQVRLYPILAGYYVITGTPDAVRRAKDIDTVGCNE